MSYPGPFLLVVNGRPCALDDPVYTSIVDRLRQVGVWNFRANEVVDINGEPHLVTHTQYTDAEIRIDTELLAAPKEE